MALKIGACTFDKFGKPMQFLQDSVDAKLTEKQFAALQAQHAFPHALVFTPGPGTAAVRLLVKDAVTGEMGSVNVPYVETTAVATPPAAAGGTTDKPANR